MPVYLHQLDNFQQYDEKIYELTTDNKPDGSENKFQLLYLVFKFLVIVKLP